MLPCIIHEAVNYFYIYSASIFFLRKLFENQTLEKQKCLTAFWNKLRPWCCEQYWQQWGTIHICKINPRCKYFLDHNLHIWGCKIKQNIFVQSPIIILHIILIYNFKIPIKLPPTKKNQIRVHLIHLIFLLPPFWMLNKQNSINCYRWIFSTVQQSSMHPIRVV